MKDNDNFFVGQKIEGITPDKKLFEGFYAEVENKQTHLKESVVCKSDGTYIRLENLFNPQEKGRNLRESAEEVISDIINKLDPEKIKNMPDTDRKAIKDVIKTSLGPDASGNEDKIDSMVDSALMQNQFNNSTDSKSTVIQKYAKDEDKNSTSGNTLSTGTSMKEADVTSNYLDEIADSNDPDPDDKNEPMTGSDDISEDQNSYGIYDDDDLNLTDEELEEELEEKTKNSYDRNSLVKFIQEQKGLDEQDANQFLDDFLNKQNGIAVDASDYDEDFIDNEVNDIFENEDDNASIDELYEACLKHFDLENMKENFKNDSGLVDETSFDKMQEQVIYQRKLEKAYTPKRFIESMKKYSEEQINDVFLLPDNNQSQIIGTTVTNEFQNTPLILANNENELVNSDEDLNKWNQEVADEIINETNETYDQSDVDSFMDNLRKTLSPYIPNTEE